MTSDVELLDTIKSGFGLQTDSAVAGFLGITPTSIHRVRHNQGRFGVMQRLKVLDRVAFLRARSLLEQISPEYLRNAIQRMSHQQANRLAKSRSQRQTAATADAQLLDAAKDVLGFATDVELADFLGLARHRMSMVRTGRSTLGPKPRLRLLNRIEPFDLEKVIGALDSSEELIRQIRDFQQQGGRQDGSPPIATKTSLNPSKSV